MGSSANLGKAASQEDIYATVTMTVMTTVMRKTVKPVPMSNRLLAHHPSSGVDQVGSAFHLTGNVMEKTTAMMAVTRRTAHRQQHPLLHPERVLCDYDYDCHDDSDEKRLRIQDFVPVGAK
ncbi:hypothetical protein SK128_017448 [Halocaridina rubra]|uniref:Uncharacterized protein n=1 Tax=Halocaridina rubra TaxID=373956 RepID=A0AAN9ADX7_HALRR